jgi:two-component system, sporulation sensor kinase E
MRKFIEKTLARLDRLNEEQTRSILRALAQENGTMEAALDSMLDGIVVCDLEHFPTIYNKSAERMLRLSGPDPTERPLWQSVEDEDLADFFRSTLESEETLLGREFGLESKGSVRLVAVSVSPLVSQGRISGAIVHLEDITDKRRKESQLRRAESLASLTTLAAGVAHEIKNPLGSISIHIQLIKKALKRSECVEPELIERHLAVVDEEIERLNKTVVDFLFAVRPMDLKLREAEPGNLLREMAEFMRPEAESAGVDVELEIGDSLPRVLLDERYMKQAILNLVKNALAAMPGGGRLLLKAEGQPDEVRITISDSGTGIAEENLPKIFEPYFTTKDNGTGLGLTITFKIVKEHGGEITVDSKPGQGSSFTITLPVPQRDRRLIEYSAAGGSGADAARPAAEAST